MIGFNLKRLISMSFGTIGAVSLAVGAVTEANSTNDDATLSSLSLKLPPQAQIIDIASFVSLPVVPPTSEYNGTTIWIPPGKSRQDLINQPFLVYDKDFLDIIGDDPTLTIVAESAKDPIFHEAVVWYPPTDEVFFAQNAGHPDAGTGLNKSSIVQKISMEEAMEVVSEGKDGRVKVHRVDSNPQVINPNGGTNYRGDILFTGEGMGNKTAPALYAVNPVPPYNATILANNFYGRQFNSLNDVSVNPRNKHIYFTDPLYGYFQDFRPAPVLPIQVYRLNPDTKAITVVASEFDQANGITFSPCGRYAYIADSGAQHANLGYFYSAPTTIYRFTVAEDGTFEDRKTFAFADNGIPDGIHCDSNGNVYAGCGDGVHVWNKSGKLLGKIFTDGVSANFQFAGDGRMIICAETRLYLATVAAKGAPIQ